MMNLLMYNSNRVEVINYKDKILFNPYDVGSCLDMKEETVRYHIRNFNKNQVIKLKKSDVGLTNNLNIPPSGRSFLTESGVYKLSFKSRKSVAEKFTDWVTDEVLPSIRKTGRYDINGQQLELEPYNLEFKTYKGEPVMFVRDLVYFTGRSKDALNWIIKRDGLGLLLQGRSLNDFRQENKSIIGATRRINILFNEDILEIMKSYAISDEKISIVNKYFNNKMLIPKEDKRISLNEMKILQKIENLNNLQYLVNKFCYDEQMKGDITEIISKRFVDLGFLEKKCRDFNINGIEGWNLFCKIQEYKGRISNN